ncbi:MAG TPA: sensor histidine kinase [Thermoanaerobaculia bacterium]|jgi:signal transduction histidine kinase|nr:sensor histidine kinase [Thermoanaerobaculia bacterium]
MKQAWPLTLINAALALALGLGFVLVPDRVLDLLPFFHAPADSGAIALLRLLGALLCGLGLMLLILPPLKLSSPRRMLLTTVHTALAFVWIYLPLASREDPHSVELTVRIALHASSLFLVLGLLSFIYRFGGTGPAAEDPAADSLDESAAQQERNRLARDLHDSIKQQLFSIRLSSAAAEERWEADPGGARAALADVRRSSQEAMVEMRALLAQLRPEPLATVGLVEALREQCEALGYRCGIPVDFEIGELPPDDRLPSATQENLFRIAQEALSNIAHHSRARSVQARLGQVGQDGSPALLLRVRDDGQGFEPASRPAGMGLRNMRERLEAAGGTLEVESAPGQGTEVRARMPLTPPKALAAAPRTASRKTSGSASLRT